MQKPLRPLVCRSGTLYHPKPMRRVCKDRKLRGSRPMDELKMNCRKAIMKVKWKTIGEVCIDRMKTWVGWIFIIYELMEGKQT